MHAQETHSVHRRWNAPVVLRAALLMMYFTATAAALAQPTVAVGGSGRITFPATLVPKFPASLPTVKLTVQAPPEAFLRETLGKAGLDTTAIKPLASTALPVLRAAPKQVFGLQDGDRITAYWNSQTGESQIFPRLEKLPSVPFAGAGDSHLSQALTVARGVFARADVIPRDVTQYTLSEPRPVVGSTAQRQPGSARPVVSPAKLYLTYVALQRTVNGYKMVGTGSRAAVAVGTEGNVHALVSRWRAASLAAPVRETRTPQQIQAAITALLQPYTSNSNVEVVSVEVVYYDQDQAAVAPPLFRVTSRLHPLPSREGNNALASTTDYMVNYLPYGNAQLPAELVPGSGVMPAAAPRNTAELVVKPVPIDDPTVGMYVVRDSPAGAHPSDGFVAEANGFWDGLHSSHASGSFTKSQYYWAEPRMYNTQEASFVNSVNVALTEAHGAPWLFTTESNCCDDVDINAIPASQGYGAANHGKLAYWIIHSCSVVPSAQDNAQWWTPWFKVFQGLHAVMGSRVEMYFDSGAVNKPFGQNIGNGAAVVPAWFNATLSYYPASKQPPIDRPSAVTVCGHEQDTVFNVGALPAASCLTNYWQPN